MKSVALVLLTVVTSLLVQGTLSDDPLTCANCATKTRAKIIETCSESELHQLIPQTDCEEASTANTDAELETKVCEPLGVCGTTFVSCNTCITKMRAVIDTLCDELTGAKEITIFTLTITYPYKDSCKRLAAATEDSAFDYGCGIGNGIVGTDSWGYDSCNGPSVWSTTYGYTDCSASNQSPIDLDSTAAAASLLTFSSDYKAALPGTVANNGRHLVFTFDSAPTATVTGLLLDFNTYTPVEIKFHWGSTNEQGSEHRIDGKSSAMEMQVIHRNTKYASMADALVETDGVLIMGFLFKMELGPHIDIFQTEIKAIFDATNQFSVSETSTINMNDFLSAVDINGFFKYTGSLTEPECNEDVTWIVFAKELAVRQQQLNYLRKLKNLDWVLNADNFRTPQPLSGRTVERYEA